MCCSELQCVAVSCSVLQCVAVWCLKRCIGDSIVAVCCSVLQCVAVCCSVLQCVHLLCARCLKRCIGDSIVSHTSKRHVTFISTSRHVSIRHVTTHICMSHTRLLTGRQKFIGCPKSQVIFRERATNYRALLRKMTYKDKASYGSSPPCIHEVPQNMQT